MAVDLQGKVVDQTSSPKVGLTVELYEAATWEAAGAATSSTITDADGLWKFLAQDATKIWLICVIDGTKKFLIDARNTIQLTKLDLITDMNVDTINEHTAAAGVTIDSFLIKDGGLPTFGKTVLKSADEVINNISTLQDDNELVFTAGANEVCYLTYWLMYRSGTTPDIKFQFSLPTGGVMQAVPQDVISVIAAQGGITPWDGTGSSIIFNGAGAAVTQIVIIWALYVGGGIAGNIILRWAQNTADVSDTKVLQNSFIIWRKLG